MDLDHNALLLTLYAGACVASTEAVKEATKDAYQGLKSVIAKVCGTRAKQAFDSVETAPLSDDARTKLREAIGTIPKSETGEVSAALALLQNRLKDDAAACQAAEAVAGIKLKVVSGGHVKIERIEDAKSIDVASHSTGDFTFSDVKMARGPEGN